MTSHMAFLGCALIAECSCRASLPAHTGSMPDGTVDDTGMDGDGLEDGADDDRPPIPDLLELRIEPEAATITDDGVAPGESTTFVVMGTFGGGERDVTDEVNWQLEKEDLATIDEGVATSIGIGGTTQVRVFSGSIEAFADLTIRLEVSVPIGETSPDAPTMFPTDMAADVTEDVIAPRIVYPSHETMFPRNLERVLHQWDAGAGLDLFEVRFDSAVAALRFYTTESTFLPTPEIWQWIARSHAGASLTMTVRGVNTLAPETIYRSSAIELYYSADDVLGALYYWSTGAEGVMRAALNAPVATKFFTDPESDDETCVACHTVSRNGRRLAVGYGGERLRWAGAPDRIHIVESDR